MQQRQALTANHAACGPSLAREHGYSDYLLVGRVIPTQVSGLPTRLITTERQLLQSVYRRFDGCLYGWRRIREKVIAS